MKLKDTAKSAAVGVVGVFSFLFDFVFPRGILEEEIASLDADEVFRRSDRAERPDESYLRPILSYRDQFVRNLVWLLKYKENRKVAFLFAEILRDRIMEDLSEAFLFEGFERAALVPIPMSASERRLRGFNQAETLCRELLENSGGFFRFEPELLLKTRETKSQSSIKRRAERLKNIRNCYAVRDASAVKNRNVILIDDVITTGSTMKEARRALLSAGAKKVLCYAVAH